MAHDITLIKHTLEVLKLHDGNPAPLDTLASEVEMYSARKLDTAQVKASLLFLFEDGCAGQRTDRLGRDLWTITEKGKSTSF